MKDPQQQTFVTKHDLALLHKKIIATDLIVQKYQEANKALLALQVENDRLRQQIEQITNECCIFGKQVTECTQECDHLQEQIELFNAEKRDLHNQLRLLRDENTNYYHEVMILKQYESLKEINDQATKTIERQQKDLTKLQLKLQRRSPIVYKPNKTSQEPSATDIALINSQKSVRELKLALGRLINFIQTSKLEIPTSLNIRPVLKAHDINDDFLEFEGEFVLQPVKKKVKRIVNPVTVDDDDTDDDENGDFIDVTPVTQPAPVVTSVPLVDSCAEIPKSSSGEEKKKKERTKKTKTPKSSKRKRRGHAEEPVNELDDLANELEMAISQTEQQPPEPPSNPISFFSEEENDDDKLPKPNQQQTSRSINTPMLLQQPAISRATTSTFKSVSRSITTQNTTSYQTQKSITRDISFLSDDDAEDRLESLPSVAFTSNIQPRASSILPVQDKIVTSLQDDIEASNKLRKSIGCLSEDDDQDPVQSLSSVIPPTLGKTTKYSSRTNEKITAVVKPTHLTTLPSPSPVDDVVHRPSQSDNSMIDVPQKSSSSLKYSQSVKSTETIAKSSQPMFKNTTEKKIAPTPDSPQFDLVLRLLHVLTQVPVPMKPLRLFRRRSRSKKISREKSPTENTSHNQLSEPLQEQSTLIEGNDPIIYNTPKDRLESVSEQLKPMEEDHPDTQNNPIIDNIPEDHRFESMAEPATSIEENPPDTQYTSIMCNIQEDHILQSVAEQLKPMEEDHPDTQNNPIIDNIPDDHRFESMTKPVIPIEENPPDTQIIAIMCTLQEDHILQSVAEQAEPMEEDHCFQSVEQQSKPVDDNQVNLENDTTKNEICQEQQKLIEETSADELVVTQDSSSKAQTHPLPPICDLTSYEQPSVCNYEPETATAPVNSDLKIPSLLKPSYITTISRLLHVLTTLPVNPTHFPMSFPVRKRKPKATVVKKSSVTRSRPPSNRIARSPTRMQTRSLTSIHACIVRCNRPTTLTKKRTINDSLPPTVVKRMKSSRIETPQDEYARLQKYLREFSKEITDELKTFIERKLQEDTALFSDHFYRLINEMMMSKCDIILPLVKHLHPHEESMRILLAYINSKSTVLQQHFLGKLKQTFECEIQQKPITINRIKILNRLFFLTCSIFTSSPSIIYARLFDIGYCLSRDVLLDAISFVEHTCSSLMSLNSSNTLLHRILFEFFSQASIHPSLEYLENLLVTYSTTTHNRDDCLRSFSLICRHQTWIWCSRELCAKLLLPMVNRIDQRRTILILLQYILFIYKDNDQFQQDTIFHDRVKQLLLSLKTINSDECIVRDKIFFMLHTRV